MRKTCQIFFLLIILGKYSYIFISTALCAEFYSMKCIKGTVEYDLRTPFFFSELIPRRLLINILKTFRIWSRFCNFQNSNNFPQTILQLSPYLEFFYYKPRVVPHHPWSNFCMKSTLRIFCFAYCRIKKKLSAVQQSSENDYFPQIVLNFPP